MTRPFSKIPTDFFTSPQGQQILAFGSFATVVAIYLLSNPHVGSLGAYRLPSAYACDDLNCDADAFNEAIQQLQSIDFLAYDVSFKTVWIKDSADLQWGLLSEKDKAKIKHVQTAFDALDPKLCFLEELFNRYKNQLSLTAHRARVVNPVAPPRQSSSAVKTPAKSPAQAFSAQDLIKPPLTKRVDPDAHDLDIAMAQLEEARANTHFTLTSTNAQLFQLIREYRKLTSFAEAIYQVEKAISNRDYDLAYIKYLMSTTTPAEQAPSEDEPLVFDYADADDDI